MPMMNVTSLCKSLKIQFILFFYDAEFGGTVHVHDVYTITLRMIYKVILNICMQISTPYYKLHVA